MKKAQLGCASCPAQPNLLRFGLLALAVCFGSVGCSSGTSDAGDQAEVGPIEAMYLMSAAMVQAQNRIQEEAVQSCMRGRGFDYQMRLISFQQAELLANTERFDNQRLRETRYGLRDSAALIAPPTTAPDPNQATLDSMDDATRAAYLRALTLAEDNSPACDQLGEEAAHDAAYGPATDQLSGVVGEVSTRVTRSLTRPNRAAPTGQTASLTPTTVKTGLPLSAVPDALSELAASEFCFDAIAKSRSDVQEDRLAEPLVKLSSDRVRLRLQWARGKRTPTNEMLEDHGHSAAI